MGILVPAVLPTSREDLEEKLSLYARMPQVKRVQIDVVDGEYASPMSWPYTTKEKIEPLPLTNRFEYEIDLMCLDAPRAAEAWLALGATRLTFHLGAVPNLAKILKQLRSRYAPEAGFVPDLIAFGVAIDRKTSFSAIDAVLAEVDYVQFMGIDTIGRQGELFNPKVLERIRVFRGLHPELPVQVDGGVTLERGRELLGLGVHNLISGSAILKADDPLAMAMAFENLKTPYGV